MLVTPWTAKRVRRWQVDLRAAKAVIGALADRDHDGLVDRQPALLDEIRKDARLEVRVEQVASMGLYMRAGNHYRVLIVKSHDWTHHVARPEQRLIE